MSKNKKKRLPKKSLLTEETKNSILAILLIGLAVLLFLASFQKAGPAGQFIYSVLYFLFGSGYYLLPIIALIMAAVFIAASQKKILGVTLIGATLFLLSFLGIIDLILPNNAGLIGKGIGAIDFLLGSTAGIILMSTFAIASLFLMVNGSIQIKKPVVEEKPVIIETIVPSPNQNETSGKTDDEEKSEAAKISKKEPETELKTPRKKTILTTITTGGSPAKNYIAPPISLLKSSVEKPSAGDLRANANIIKRTLDSFGIPVEMGEISIGPKVTRYTLKPAEGIKLSRIIALNQDLALALAAHPIRIEAPIPGKSLVGIEVPNKSAAIVRLGSLIAYEDFQNSGPLNVIIGRDVSGEPILADIEKMPHLLVAGATGSGKSVAIHAMLISLLYKNSPETLKLILIDPKRVELSIYDDLPHLVTPVITEGKKAISALRWAIQEMERRYEVLLGAGSRDIISYNKSHSPSLSYLFIIIDELADLMTTYGREVEGSIVRLAQMARATGIHLIVSTQRPSVEVITGLIKANITSRIALQVASQIDSRTILDTAGAEKLLGGGDMLFISSEFSKPKRIQGSYIAEEEINAVADFIRSNNSKNLESEITNLAINSPAVFEQIEENEEEDDLYNEAVRIVREAKKASASLLQRRLKVGYARAARLLDMMEANGLIGPGEGAKPREVYEQQENKQNE